MFRSLSTTAPSSATPSSTVFVVDDDNGLREAIQGLLESVGHEVRTFRSAEEFLASCDPSEPGCLVLDVRLPETSGLELQKRLVALDYRLPIVFISGHGDVPMTVQAMKGGAIDFLLKPFREQDLLDTIQAALRRDRIQRDEVLRAHKELANARSLTAREREIMQHVVTGEINKQIAYTLGLSEVTVKIHRAQVMRKMGASSLADLVRIADKLKAVS